MKNRNTLIMSGLLALTLGLGVSNQALAFQGDLVDKGSKYSLDFKNQLAKVMEANDYEGWKSLIQNTTGQVDPLITKDNFPKFAEAWRLAKEGKIKEANAIRKELGLKAQKNSGNTDIDNDNDVSNVAGKDTDNDSSQLSKKSHTINKNQNIKKYLTNKTKNHKSRLEQNKKIVTQ